MRLPFMRGNQENRTARTSQGKHVGIYELGEARMPDPIKRAPRLMNGTTKNRNYSTLEE